VLSESKIFYDTSILIEIPDKTIPGIRGALKDSFSLFFHDPPAAANKIRIALELFLDELKIPRFTTTVRHKKRRLNLNERIQKIKGKAVQFQDHMQVFRILGNEGSHEAELNIDKMLDLYDVLEHFFIGIL
jgi:hypothetical protein